MFWKLCLYSIVFTYYVARAAVSIHSSGGYKNVVVGIDPKIPESKVRDHLLELEVLFGNASRILNTATRGQTFFEEIVIALPNKYRSSVPEHRLLTEGDYFSKPDIILTAGDPFSEPYALQNDGCGKPGLRIHLPDQFLSSKGTEKAKALVKEWAKFRYGVFDESGFVGDKLYPACYTVPGSEVTKVTDCADREVTYNIRQKSKESCDPAPAYGKNSHVSSSLMSRTDLPQVTHFCDDDSHPHNRNVPSKHNLLCREQSTWKIISQHSDFKFHPIRKHKKDVNSLAFKYVAEPVMRLVVAVDTSNSMVQNDRLDMVRNAFSYFVLYNLPEYSVVGLKNLRNKDENPSLVTVRTPAEAERLIDTFPEAYGEEEVCIHCGIEQAIQTLKVNSALSPGEILVITATDVDESQISNLESALRKDGTKLYVMYFRKQLKDIPRLQRLAESSSGSFFYIPEDFNSESSMSSLTLIYEAFRSIYESFSWLHQKHVLVNQQTFLKNSCTTCSISFQTDKSMESFQVLLTGPQFLVGPPVIRDKTVLSNGNQNFSAGHSSFSYKIKIPAYVFTIKNPKPSSWSLTFERRPATADRKYDKPIVVIIRSFDSKNDGIVSMKTWINTETSSTVSTPKRPSIAFYSELKKEHLPVLNATVSASLYHPESGDEILLDLTDNGDGDPDITGNDGIFSRYFSHVPKSGYYILTSIATRDAPPTQFEDSAPVPKSSRCCGSSFPAVAAYDAGSFKRIVTYGSFYVAAESVGIEYPPRRINNLHVSDVKQLKGRVGYVLEWTAPGSNYDYGVAIDYHLRLFKNRSDATTDFDSYVLIIDNFHVHGQMLDPFTAGTPQSVIVELKNITSGTYYLAMRSINAAGDTSDVSNVVEVAFKAPLVPLIPPTTPPDPETVSPTTDLEQDGKLAMDSAFKLTIGLTTGFVFLLFVIGIFLYLYCARLRKDRKADEAMRQRVISRYGGGPSFDDVHKTESRDALCNSTNNVNVSVISPINSWPANSLLSHYETLQKNKHSDTSEGSLVPPKDFSETSSIASSSKYSYINKVDQNSSLYDQIYFPPQLERDQMNYPYNPSYGPFNPPYTSSLRRNLDDSPMGHSYSSSNIDYHTYRSDRSRIDRLGTDL